MYHHRESKWTNTVTVNYLTNIQSAYSKIVLTDLGGICHYLNPLYCHTLGANKILLWLQPTRQLSATQLLTHFILPS